MQECLRRCLHFFCGRRHFSAHGCALAFAVRAGGAKLGKNERQCHSTLDLFTPLEAEVDFYGAVDAVIKAAVVPTVRTTVAID